MEAQTYPFDLAINLGRDIERGVEYHSRGLEDSLRRNPDGPRLVRRALRTANHVLAFALDPEVRRMIRDIGEDRYERNSGPLGIQRLLDRAIEMRNQRNHQIGLRLLPVSPQHLHLRAVTHAH